jgi:hypothetical protein
MIKAQHEIRFAGDMQRSQETRFYRTKTGIEIGAEHTRPPPLPSDDAERIQAALLLVRRRASPLRRPPGLLQRLRAWLASTKGAQ